MSYVSAYYAPTTNLTPDMPQPKDGQRPVVAVDDQGNEWHLTEDSIVGDWLRYIEDGGQITEN